MGTFSAGPEFRDFLLTKGMSFVFFQTKVFFLSSCFLNVVFFLEKFSCERIIRSTSKPWIERKTLGKTQGSLSRGIGEETWKGQEDHFEFEST